MIITGVLKLADLSGTNGFQLKGVSVGNKSGVVSASGDVNGDGGDDLLIGAYSA